MAEGDLERHHEAEDRLQRNLRGPDIGVKQLYKLKFKGHLSELTKLRVSLENAVGKGDVFDKKVFKSASAAVDACKADIQAWSKVRSVYVDE